jgi:hypothetical protein
MLPRAVQLHGLLACVINIPLYLLFGWGDEVRALSMLDITAALLLCEGISAWLANASRRAPAAHPVAGGVPERVVRKPALNLTGT